MRAFAAKYGSWIGASKLQISAAPKHNSARVLRNNVRLLRKRKVAVPINWWLVFDLVLFGLKPEKRSLEESPFKNSALATC